MSFSRKPLVSVVVALCLLGGCAGSTLGSPTGEPATPVIAEEQPDEATAQPTEEPVLLQVRRIWDEAPHNAFTDLVRFRDRWYCVFREGNSHVSPDGSLRVIVSENGEEWRSAALISSELGDLRDAKIVVASDGRLMLSGAVAIGGASTVKEFQSLVWFSDDGTTWSEAIPVGDPDVWLWRVTWHQDAAYGIGYATGEERFIRLYKSEDGQTFDVLVEDLGVGGYPNETSILFDEDGSALCLLRRDPVPGGSATAQMGRSMPPYTVWTWMDLGLRIVGPRTPRDGIIVDLRIGGPHMIRLPDGRLVAATRFYDGGGTRTVLSWVDAEAGILEELLTLPSRGDTSYPGLVYHEGVLWISYYSSHQEKTAIYLAKVRL